MTTQTTTNPKGDCFFSDAMAWLLVKAARTTDHGPSSLLERFHRADADGLFDGKVWGNISATELSILWDDLQEDYL